MNIPYVMRKCTKCGRWLVASTVNFGKAKNGKYKLNSKCKECWNKKNKQWIEANRDKVTEYKKQWRKANPEYNKQYRQANRDKLLEQKKRWRKANPEYYKQYRQANRDKLFEYHKEYYEANKKKILEYKKQWKDANPEYYKQYYQTPQGQVVRFNSSQRRRIKEEQQGSGITKDQWLEMMKFFDFRCAYSGETLSKNTRSIDHIVPIDVGGDHMIWNCVPMLRSLNSSKNSKDMLEWYKEQSFYDPKRLAKIYEWQEYAYNKWGKDTQYFNSGDIQIKLI